MLIPLALFFIGWLALAILCVIMGVSMKADWESIRQVTALFMVLYVFIWIFTALIYVVVKSEPLPESAVASFNYEKEMYYVCDDGDELYICEVDK